MVDYLDNLAKEILSYVEKDRIITGQSIINRQCLKGGKRENWELVHDTLRVLVEQGRLKDLYPLNVKPGNARMSQTYYMIPE